jgi:hypothetical protein
MLIMMRIENVQTYISYFRASQQYSKFICKMLASLIIFWHHFDTIFVLFVRVCFRLDGSTQITAKNKQAALDSNREEVSIEVTILDLNKTTKVTHLLDVDIR